MLGNDAPVLADYNAVGIGMHLDRTPNRARSHRVFVVVEAHQAGLRDRCRHCVESIEPAGIGNELWPFRLEHLPDCLLGQFWMAVRLGVAAATQFLEYPWRRMRRFRAASSGLDKFFAAQFSVGY